jgi:hypothetical protein
MRDCERCDGKGQRELFYKPGVIEECNACEGTGVFAEVDESAILELILAKQGKNKGKLRASMTSPLKKDGILKNRAYYVWRMARFHGGVDMTMPVMAGYCVSGDPYTSELDDLSDKVARESLGSDLRGAMRWGRALGML